ncbi:Hypothetical_protein [Hexamita inflata]|uniref:Hypothetical_protein n=1 Tax=Hexamita inflata TaxID=28002 RepID=A0AA86TMB6_9EUKA|nr:Hypothetical protein HINF_LOCUS9331 [Hexamita inflata]
MAKYLQLLRIIIIVVFIVRYISSFCDLDYGLLIHIQFDYFKRNYSHIQFLNPLNNVLKTALNLCARSQSDYSAPVQIILPDFQIEFVPNFLIRKYIWEI